MVDRNPMHQAAEDEHAVRILRERIAYARSDGVAHFSMWIQPRPHMARLIRTFLKRSRTRSDALLIPENESMRYFAYPLRLILMCITRFRRRQLAPAWFTRRRLAC